MNDITIYNLNQPTFLNSVSIFDLQNHTNFLNKEKAKRHYEKKRKILAIFLNNLEETNGTHYLLISGKILKRLQHDKDLCRKLKILTQKNVITPLSETTHQGLSHLVSEDEFKNQLVEHQTLCKKVFGVKPNIYVDAIKSFTKENTSILNKLQFNFVLSNNIATEGKINDLTVCKLDNNLVKIKESTKPTKHNTLTEFKNNTKATLLSQTTTLNQMQTKILQELKKFETYIKESKQEEILHIWQALTCNHVFTTMCNKTNNTHHEHPHNNAYEVHLSVMNILNGLAHKLTKKEGEPLKIPKIYNSPSAILG